ncbi:MAG: class I SAM-dependent methyltransferase [Bacteroidota bacterium]
MLNTEYWNNEGVQKVFTHSICSEWLACLSRDASILDLGCGYGRLTPELEKEGFNTLFGYDFSAPLIERAIRENPGSQYTSNVDELKGKYFDLILCFALFTSCPSSGEQSNLVSLINSLTKEKAFLYISDYEIADNPGYNERYEQRELNTYGCFKSGTAIFRHHDADHFDNLLLDWRRIKEKTLNSKTLNGNEIKIHQYLYTKGMG